MNTTQTITTMSIKRRNFIKKTLIAVSGIALVPNFTSCRSDHKEGIKPINDDKNIKNFDEGVASFDPTTNQVIIWTRYNTSKASAKISYHLAADEKFENIVRQGEVDTDASRDYTVAVEIKELEAGQKLYFRFSCKEDETTSVVGETFTFANDVSDVTFALASCANYANGYFNVYEEIMNSDADAVVHLGDYIYEYGDGEYGDKRKLQPSGEIISLDDYRTRYRQYRQDSKLKDLHQKKPFICVWDDHEVANDTYKGGAENHQPNEGDFGSRKADALKAYSEYLPNMTNMTDNNVIYRTLKIGNLIDLIMLDTRVIGRDKQLSYTDPKYYTLDADNKPQFDLNKFGPDLMDPNRTMLGATQLGWLASEISASTGKWQIIGQQVLMGKMMLPAEMIVILGKITSEAEEFGSAKPETFEAFSTAVSELVLIKLKPDSSLTPEERARINTVAPYNLDAWDGYPVEREKLLALFKSKKVAVIAGDTHNAWQSDLVDKDKTKVGDEIATSSVSSPGLEKYLGVGPQTAKIEFSLRTLVDDLNYVNASERGFVKMTVNTTSIDAKWIFIDTIEAETFTASVKKEFSF